MLIGKPGEVEGNPCGDHPASSPPAGRQEQSQDVETGPDCNVQDDPQSTQDFSHLEVLSPEMQWVTICHLSWTPAVPQAAAEDAEEQEAANQSAEDKSEYKDN